jgi:hypothetical protein
LNVEALRDSRGFLFSADGFAMQIEEMVGDGLVIDSLFAGVGVRDICGVVTCKRYSVGYFLQVLQVFTGAYRCLQVVTGRVRGGSGIFTGCYRCLQVFTGCGEFILGTADD